MVDFKQGVSWYTKGAVTIKVAFPEDDIRCLWCQFCEKESGHSRYRCSITNDILYNPDFDIGINCPVKFDKEE